MEAKRYQQTNIVDADGASVYDRYETQQRDRASAVRSQIHNAFRDVITFAVMGIGAIIVLVAFLVGIIGNMKQFLHTSSVLMDLFLQWLIPGIVVLFLLFILRKLYEAVRLYRQDNVELAKVRAETSLMQAEAEEIRARARQLQYTLPVDERGNLVIFDPTSGYVRQITGQAPQFPLLTSYHNSPKHAGAGEDIKALPSGEIKKPSLDEIAEQIKPNSLELCLGRSLKGTFGEYIIAELLDSHLKVIGATRMGKSCLAGAILRQIEMTHTPDRLCFALLDLEYKTSRLFEQSNHLAIVRDGRRAIPAHAKSFDEIPGMLHLIAMELERRDRLTYDEVESLPHILVYLEEFLNLKKRLKTMGGKVLQQFLTDFNTLSTRGVKLGVHALVCAQVDYADEDLKESMNQFIGLNASFGVRPQAAMAAGFVNSELLNENYSNRVQGQFVVESFSGADIGAAPNFDVRTKIKELETASRKTTPEISSRSSFHDNEITGFETTRNKSGNDSRNEYEAACNADLYEKMLLCMEKPGETIREAIPRVWGVKPNASEAYQQARAEYEQVQKMIHDLARQSFENREG